MFDKHGAPRRKEDYRRQFQRSRPKTFIPPTDVPQEKWIEPVNHKGGKKPKWRVLEKETTSLEKKRGYTIPPNYKGKNSMTRTQWRRYQQNKKVGKVVTNPQLKPSETVGKEKQKVVGPGKIVANQTVAMTIYSTGKKEVIATQNVECLLEVEKQPRSVGQSKEEEPKYSPQPEEGESEYSPQSDEEFDEDMYDENNNDIYGTNLL